MKVAKQAVFYYCKVTGKAWSEFFNRLDEAVETSYDAIGDDRELWLIKKLLEVVLKSISLNELKANKDDIKGVFDEEARKNAGEFFTPEVWAVEARKYLDKYIEDWHSYTVWDASCYTMNTLIYIRRAKTEVMLSTIINPVEVIDERNSVVFWQGWVQYKDLRRTDLILTFDMNTENTEWCSYYNAFVKNYSGALCTFRYNKGSLTVTGDHKMLVYSNSTYEKIEASELIKLIESNQDKIYRLVLDTTTMVDIEDYDVEGANNIDVWDLTTLNDSHIFAVKDVNAEVGVFSSNCGSGNLMRTAKHPADKLYLSSLQPEDIVTIHNTKEYEGVEAFQLDFLSGLDYDQYNTEFLNKLPPRLKEIIMNDEKLIFFMNPPYKSGQAKKTDVGRFMCSPIHGDLGKSAYDLFYQFCWRVMHFVEMFNLSNVYYCFFGPLTFFSGSSAKPLYREFQHCFEFVDGMCIPAQDFSGTSESIDWGIGCTLWKSRGGYVEDVQPKGILIEKKFLDPDGNIKSGGRTLYTPPRKKIEDWLQPEDVTAYKQAPLCTSHLTFKGSDTFEKIAPKSGTIATNALGVMMLDSTLARGNSYSAILSLPSTIQFMNITEENFWRCVASFSFRNNVNSDWSDSRKWQSAPDTTVDGYEEWLMNSLVSFLCEHKSMAASLRGIQWSGEVIDVQNKLFPISMREVQERCNDDIIIKDMHTHPAQNKFILQQIAKAKPYWTPEAEELFNWQKEYVLYSLNERKKYDYKGSLDAWDACFTQVRSVIWDDSLNDDLTKRLAPVRDQLGRNIDRFGFLSELDLESAS